MRANEFTLRAILLGIPLTMLLAASNTYLAVKLGMTVSASIPAAVIALAIFGMLPRPDIREGNIVQTMASAGESLAAGATFTMPALIILGYWQSFDYFWTLSLVGLGGIIGVLVVTPLRRALLDDPQLLFPEGRATADILKTGFEKASGAAQLVTGSIVAAIFVFGQKAMLVWSSKWAVYTSAGKAPFVFSINLSPAMVGVGYIVGLNIAALIFIGGAFAWFIAIPVFAEFFAAGDADFQAKIAGKSISSAYDYAIEIWDHRIRFLGAGAMLVGGLWSLYSMRRNLVGLAGKSKDEDAPMMWVGLGLLACVLPMYFIYNHILGAPLAAIPLTGTMLVAAAIFGAVAAYMAGLVGSSHNPVSGMTISTIILACLLLLALGIDKTQGPMAAIMVAAVVCCAAAIGGDTIQDLKAGQLVGASPRKQMVAQLLGVSAAMLIIPIVLQLLMVYGEFGSDELPAAQATIMASISKGIFDGNLPWGMIGVGAGLGVLIIIGDEVLRKRDSNWRLPVLAVAIGAYLPLYLATIVMFGGIAAWLVTKSVKGPEPGNKSVLLAAGLITGEALMGILLAIPAGSFDDKAWFTKLVGSVGASDLLGLAIIAVIAIWLVIVGKRQA